MPKTAQEIGEDIARDRITKVMSLVREIKKQAYESAKGLNDEDWIAIAKRAGVNAPSKSSQTLILAILGEVWKI